MKGRQQQFVVSLKEANETGHCITTVEGVVGAEWDEDKQNRMCNRRGGRCTPGVRQAIRGLGHTHYPPASKAWARECSRGWLGALGSLTAGEQLASDFLLICRLSCFKVCV